MSIQTAAAGAFCGMMAIDLAFDLPVILRGSQDDLLVRIAPLPPPR